MTQVTSPDGIVKWTFEDPASIPGASQAQGDSVQLALDKRQRYDFVWANSAGRTSQLGMVQGSRGYQSDTKSEYLYDNSTWRLAVPYALFSGSYSMTNGAWTSTVPSIDAGVSTDTTFVTTGTATYAYLNFVNPGVYAITWKNTLNTNHAASLQQMTLNTTGTTNDPYAISTVIPVASLGHLYTSIGALRTSAANTRLHFMAYQASGAAQTSNYTINVVRLG